MDHSDVAVNYLSATSGGGFKTSDTTSCVYYPDWNWDYYYSRYYTIPIKVEVDRYKQAFNIVKMMMKRGIIGDITISKYNQLIEDIVKELTF